jgi:hypothetical protein
MGVELAPFPKFCCFTWRRSESNGARCFHQIDRADRGERKGVSSTDADARQAIEENLRQQGIETHGRTKTLRR